MEKRIKLKPIVIVVTGPESTGKTALCSELSDQLNAIWYPELARNYVESLNRPYEYIDVEKIARQQIADQQIAIASNEGIVLFDTGLVITKVWFDVVYGACPGFVDQYLKKQQVDLHLLCDIDIPWVPDSVRENGGEQRVELFDRYKKELENYSFAFELISGLNNERSENAKKAMQKHSLI